MKTLIALFAFHVLDESFDLDAVNIGCNVGDFRRERTCAEYEELHATIPT